MNSPKNLRFQHYLFFLTIFFFLFFIESQDAYAATFTATTTGLWNSSATWGGAGTPANADTKIINSGVTVTISSGNSVTTTGPITINSGGNLTISNGYSTGLTISTGGSITNHGSVRIQTSGSGTGVSHGAGSITNNGTMKITKSGSSGAGMTLVSPATLTNNNFSTLTVITSAQNGISSSTGSITNYGTMVATSNTGATNSILVSGAGSFVNRVGGTIVINGTGATGVRSSSSSATFTNSGTINIPSAPANIAAIALTTGATLTNNATITISATSGVGINLNSNTGINRLINTVNGTITISGTPTTGIEIQSGNTAAGNFTNSGLVTLSHSSGNGILNSPSGGTLVKGQGGTTTNAGRIVISNTGSSSTGIRNDVGPKGWGALIVSGGNVTISNTAGVGIKNQQVSAGSPYKGNITINNISGSKIRIANTGGTGIVNINGTVSQILTNNNILTKACGFGNYTGTVPTSGNAIDYPACYSSAIYNRSTGVLLLTLNDTVDATPASNVDLSKISIHGSGNSTQISLFGASVSAVDGTTLTITLNSTQKASVNSVATPQIDMASNAVVDLTGNYNDAKTNKSLNLAYSQSPSDSLGITDSISYNLVASAKQVSDTLGLTDSISTTRLSTASVSDTLGITDSISTTATRPRSVSDTLGITDSISTMATRTRSISDTLSITSSANATKVLDTTKPTFSSATLNKGTGVLTITFSELIDNTPTTDILLSRLFISNVGGVNQTALTGATITTSGNATTISITLTEAQRQAVIQYGTPQLDIGTGGPVKDLAGNTINASADNSIIVTADTVRPTFSSARLNLNTGVFNMTFSETLDNTPSTDIDLSKLFISETGTADQYVLTGATRNTSGNSTFIVVTLNSTQLANIVALNTPQLDITASAVMDTSGNTILVSPNNAITLVDTVAPTFTAKTGVGENQITITFSERVNSTSNSISQWTVDGKTVSSVTSVNGSQKTLTITLSSSISKLAPTPKVSYTKGDIKDRFGNFMGTNSTTPTDGLGPHVIVARIITPNTLVVEFDKNVTSTQGSYSNMVINGSSKTIFAHSVTGKYVTLKFSANATLGQTGQMDLAATIKSLLNNAYNTTQNPVPIVNNLGSVPITLNSTQPTLAFTVNNSPVTTVLIKDGVDSKFDLTYVPNKVTSGGKTNVTTNQQLDITFGKDTENQIDFRLPANLTITGPSANFTGLLDFPERQSTGSCPPKFEGTDSVVSCVDVGKYGVELTLNKPARIVLKGEGAHSPYYGVTPSVLRTKITVQCNADDFNTVSSQISSSGTVRECYVVSGSDMIIWTTHFTSYGTIRAGSSSSSASSGTSGSSPGSGPINVDVTDLTRSDNYDPDGFGSGISLIVHSIEYDKKTNHVTVILSTSAPPANVMIQGGTQRYSAGLENIQPYMEQRKLVYSANLPDSTSMTILVMDKRDHLSYKVLINQDHYFVSYYNPGYEKYLKKFQISTEDPQEEIVTDAKEQYFRQTEIRLKQLTNTYSEQQMNIFLKTLSSQFTSEQMKVLEKVLDKYN